jgi:hypothetical protein
MRIDIRVDNKKYIAEVWSDDQSEYLVTEGFNEAYPEEQYVDINDWCINTFGYHARTAYHVFEFKKQADLEWFVLKWSNSYAN